MDLNQNLARNITAARKARGLTQVELAAQVGRHPGYVGQAETGRRSATLRTVHWWAEKLGMEPLDLLKEPEG